MAPYAVCRVLQAGKARQDRIGPRLSHLSRPRRRRGSASSSPGFPHANNTEPMSSRSCACLPCLTYGHEPRLDIPSFVARERGEFPIGNHAAQFQDAKSSG